MEERAPETTPSESATPPEAVPPDATPPATTPPSVAGEPPEPSTAGWTTPGPVASPGLPTAAAATAPALPSTRQLLSVGLDLCLRANPSLRASSMAIGFQLMGAVGPLVVLVLVLAGRAPDLLDVMLDPTAAATEQSASVSGSIFVTGMIGAAALVALTLESRIVAVGLLGGHAIGRPVSPLEALRRSRQVFWSVAIATFLVQLFVNIVVTVAGSPIGDTEAGFVLTTALAALLSMPFVYLVSGIVLGAAPAMEAIRRSTAMAAARWRLALVVAIAETLAQALLVFGLLAGLDILARISDAFGLGLDGGPVATFTTIVIALLATAAVGSLVFTVTALAVAPQVVAFVGLTHFGRGLDRARDGCPGARRVRWVSIPMAVGIVIAFMASLGGILTALGAG